jgi:hypothetical protein
MIDRVPALRATVRGDPVGGFRSNPAGLGSAAPSLGR